MPDRLESPVRLTKSDFNAGRQCEKRLYLSRHRPELGAPSPPTVSRRVDDGVALGILGRRYYPGGALIDSLGGTAAADTAAAISNGVDCIYEAAFRNATSGLVVRADILKRLPEAPGGWHLVEVKSGTSV